MPKAVIFGCSGPHLSVAERRFFAEADPWGFILFARNVQYPQQVTALVTELRAAVGRRAPVLIDQEGGRVARLRAPHWREWAPPATLADRADLTWQEICEAFLTQYCIIAMELAALGITVNCAPVVDVPARNSHHVIGDRALGTSVEAIVRNGQAVCDGMVRGGVLPVLKHIPGHGRATVDSHAQLPVVDVPRSELENADFAPFRELAAQPIAMTAHVVYSAVDSQAPATLSATVVREVVRGTIGFQGLLMSDDIGMGALSGSIERRATQALDAGCDVVLHCDGQLSAMREVAVAVPTLAGAPRHRTEFVDNWPSPAEGEVRELPVLVARYQQIVEGRSNG